jgi:hypothetical protein
LPHLNRSRTPLLNALTDEGIVVLGGPLDNAARAMLIVTAPDEQAAVARLAGNPWARMGLRRLVSIQRWAFLLGELWAASA